MLVDSTTTLPIDWDFAHLKSPNAGIQSSETTFILYRTDLERAKELLSKAEKQWLQHKRITTSTTHLDESKVFEEHAAKSDYMIKLINENNTMKQKISQIELHSRYYILYLLKSTSTC